MTKPQSKIGAWAQRATDLDSELRALRIVRSMCVENATLIELDALLQRKHREIEEHRKAGEALMPRTRAMLDGINVVSFGEGPQAIHDAISDALGEE